MSEIFKQISISDSLSLIAIGISIYSVIETNKCSEKINKINLKAELFRAIFWKILFEDYLPLFNQLVEWNITEKEIDKMEEFIMELKRKLDIYKFTNKEFYNRVFDKLKFLDDCIVMLPNNEKDISNKKKNQILKSMEEIYQLFMKEYLN